MIRRAPARPRRGGADAGVTLIEVVVTMTIMGIFMTMFTVGVRQMYQATNRNEAISRAKAQVHVAFLRLDKEIRYASAVSKPGAVGANQVVEYQIGDASPAQCVQLRLNVAAKQLQRRAWTQGATPPATWIPIASDVTATKPFERADANDDIRFQQLTIDLTANAGAGKSAAAKQTKVTFTAMNTSLATTLSGTSDTICSEGRTP
jgi:prepilin-type N-terminal cleavage/methylation domain-containing protein